MDSPFTPPAPLPTATTVNAHACVEVALAIIFESDAATATPRLLICRRKADTVLAGYWEFPGGKCHPGESPAACAVRETQEETGLRVQVLGEMPVIEHDYPHARVRLHPFVCRHTGGTLELRGVAEALWIDPAQVDQFRFPEANTELLQQIRLGAEALRRLH